MKQNRKKKIPHVLIETNLCISLFNNHELKKNCDELKLAKEKRGYFLSFFLTFVFYLEGIVYCFCLCLKSPRALSLSDICLFSYLCNLTFTANDIYIHILYIRNFPVMLKNVKCQISAPHKTYY